MPSKVTTRLVRLREACDSLGISHDTFSRHWQDVFTETRDTSELRKGVRRMVFEDELAAAVNAGGGVRGQAAVKTLRAMLGRM